MTLGLYIIYIRGYCQVFYFPMPRVILYTMSRKQKLSPKAAKAKAVRDKKIAMTDRRRKMKAENQRKRRAAKKRGMNLNGKDYDHNTKRFVSVKTNRGGHGKGTKKYNTK